MIKIYFCGSIRGGRQLAKMYAKIIELLQNYGRVLTEHIADPLIILKEEKSQTDSEIYSQDINWLEESDLVVAEVSTPSIGVGFEIGYAVRMQKPILCLYKDGASHVISAMISGCPDIETVHYHSIEELKEPLERFIANSTAV